MTCHPQRPCMFDQSPHRGLRTAFPSVFRPLLICAKLGGWVCQGFPSPGPQQVNVGAGGIQERGGGRYRGSTCISFILTMSHPFLCASVSLFHMSLPLKPSLSLSVRPASPLSSPFPFFDLPLLPSAAKAEENEGWRVGGGEQGRKASWLGRE